MSHEKVEGCIFAVANTLFGRKWKVYAEDSHGTDNKILPSPSSSSQFSLIHAILFLKFCFCETTFFYLISGIVCLKF